MKITKYIVFIEQTKAQSWWQDLNLRPADYKSAALPLSYTSTNNERVDTLPVKAEQTSGLDLTSAGIDSFGLTIPCLVLLCLLQQVYDGLTPERKLGYTLPYLTSNLLSPIWSYAFCFSTSSG